jgi:hypothetical protein
MIALTPTQWISQCAETLHQRWHTVDAAQLEEVAVDIWKDPKLRDMPPAEAALLWLSPIVSTCITM